METVSRADEYGLGPIYVNRFEEKFFFNINRNSFTKTSAQALFEAKFGKSLFKEDTLYIIVGTDSGLLPGFIQNKQIPKGSRYIFIEPDAVLTGLKQEKLLIELDKDRISCISLTEWEASIQHFKIRDYFYIQGVESFNALCAEDDNIKEYAELSWHIAEVLSQLHWINTAELGCEAFISRQLTNVADNVFPAKLLEQAFAKKTVILLAGGPSLDEALPWVKLHRRRLVVFAVSRIARQLIQTEIAPDFIFSVDPTELSFDVSKEMLNFGQETTFIYSHHTVSSLINQWTGKALYLGARLPWKSDLNVPNLSSAGPTVTNTAINVAHGFGFNRIILAGVDLCFTKEGITHAKGSNEQLAGPKFNLTSLQVETNNGFMAPTSCDFAQATLSLALQAKNLKEQGCQLINVSGHAAKVENVDYLPLADITLDVDNIKVAEVVASCLDHCVRDNSYYQKMLAELKRAHFQISAIATLSEKARNINDQMYNADGIIENYKDKKKLDQIEKKFKREYRLFSRLVKAFGIRRFITITKPFIDEEWTAAEAKQMGNVFYDAYQEGTAKLLNLIDDSMARVTARQAELAEMPDFALLIAQTRKDESFGRVRLWWQRYAELTIPEQINQIFAEFEQRFTEILNNKDTQHFATAKQHNSLIILKHRAGILFKHKKLEELQALLIGLDTHQQQQAAIPYRHLINGYVAELRAEPEAALFAYQSIVLAATELLEEALVRIANISIDLNNVDSANLSLQCLSQLNPSYLPIYADIQLLRGELMAAIDSYNQYISQFPEDVLIQLKLATLYIEHKIYDAAELMLNYILQNKPNSIVVSDVKKQLLLLKNFTAA